MSGFFIFTQMAYCVYVLYSSKHDKIYIGETSNLIERIKSHNLLRKKGFTIRYRPWMVVLVEFYENRSHALKREKLLKQGQGSAWIRSKIIPLYSQGSYPHEADVSSYR
jgi:putative endonuclease